MPRSIFVIWSVDPDQLAGGIRSIVGIGHWNLRSIVPHRATEGVRCPVGSGILTEIAPTQRHAVIQDTWWDTASRIHVTRQGRAEVATQSFRLRPIMKQGTAAGLSETWIHYP